MASDWKEVALGEIFNVKHGFAFKGEFFTDEQQPTILVTPGNFAIGGGFQNPKPKYYKGQIPKDYVLKPGQIIVTMTDLSKQADTLGYTAIVPEDGNIWLHNQRIGLLEFKGSFPCDPIFINYLLRSHRYRSWIIGSASGTTVKHTSPSRIHSFRCSVPPLPEQRAIAHILGSLDDKIELNRQMNKTLEATARAIFKSWFVDFDPVRAKSEGRPTGLPDDIAALFPDSFEDSELGEIPKGWRKGSLGDVCFVKGGFAYKSKDFQDKGFPVIKIKNINSDKTVDVYDVQFIPEEIAEATKTFWLNTGDLLMAMTGATVGKFGLIVNRETKPCLLNQRVAKFYPIESISNKIWFAYCNLCQSQVLEHIINVAHGSAQPNISAKSIMETPIIFPKEQLIKVFDNTVNSLFKKMLRNQSMCRTLASLRDTLLPKLISGKLRVPDAEKFLEEAGV